MKISYLGIEILDFEKNKEQYDFNIYDVEIFRKNFIDAYKKIGTNYDELIKNLKDNGVKEPEKTFVENYIKNDKKIINKVNLNKLLKLIRKEKIQKLKLI
jgi:hypothetical protein